MTAKLDPFAAAPALMKTWHSASLAIIESLDPGLVELVEIRASQINGCANCLNMHAAWARERGESEQRIYLLSAWREAPCYTERERAALGWTEALTRLSEGRHGLRSTPGAVQRGGSGEAYAGHQQHQRLDRLSVGFGLFVDPAVVKTAPADATRLASAAAKAAA